MIVSERLVLFKSVIEFGESSFFKESFWFSSLISKETNLKSAYESLKIVKAAEIKTIPMAHGNKKSRILAWTFLSPHQQKTWVDFRWR